MKQFIVAREQEWAFGSGRIDGRGWGRSAAAPVHLCVVSVRWE
ncbi:hypothetical protein ACGYWA_06825 [Burkholderia pseudomallei]